MFRKYISFFQVRDRGGIGSYLLLLFYLLECVQTSTYNYHLLRFWCYFPISNLNPPLSAVWFTFLVVRGSGRGGNVVPLGQSIGVPNTELLSGRDFSQHAVENLQTEKKGKSGEDEVLQKGPEANKRLQTPPSVAEWR